MFNKRHNFFQFKQPKSKLPKLNISITNNKQPSSSKNVQIQTTLVASHRIESEDMWADSDNELLMLASQVTEKVDSVDEIIVSPMNGDSYVRFGFDLNKQMHTSTQKPVRDDLSDFLELNEEEERACAEFADIENFHLANKILVEENPATVVSLVNHSVSKITTNIYKTNVLSNLHIKRLLNQNGNSMDKQAYYLQKKLEQVQKEYKHLNELPRFKENCQTKYGETLMLIYELQRNKQLCDELSKENFLGIDSMKQFYFSKILEMGYVIQSQKSELEFKQLQKLSNKFRKLNKSEFDHNVFNLNMPEVSYTGIKTVEIDQEIYNNFTEIDNNGKDIIYIYYRDHDLIKYMKNLQNIFAQLMAIQDNTPRIPDDYFQEIIEIITYVLNEIRNQTKHLFSKPKINVKFDWDKPEIDYNFQNESIYQEKRMFSTEKLCAARRAIACISLICSCSSHLCKILLETNMANEPDIMEKSFFEALAEILMLIGYSKYVNKNCGLLESVCTLMCTLANHKIYSAKMNICLLRLFHATVFCQPNTRCLVKISEFLFTISNGYENHDFLNMLCWQSPSRLTIYDNYKIFQFTSETCALQIYATFLQIKFPPYKQIKGSQLEVVTKVTMDTLLLIRNCFLRPVDWIFKQPHDNVPTLCYCHVHLVCSGVRLLYLCLAQWVHKPSNIDIRTISRICQSGVFFLYDNFYMQYQPMVLYVGGEEIKNMLQVIYNWLNQYYELFGFRKPHIHALKDITLRPLRLMIEPLLEEDDETFDNEECSTPRNNPLHSGLHCIGTIKKNYI